MLNLRICKSVYPDTMPTYNDMFEHLKKDASRRFNEKFNLNNKSDEYTTPNK